MVSGPTFNYQRIIASQSDVRIRSLSLGGGAYSYTFKVPIPSTYLAPLNDTTNFTIGELTGQPLLAGTYSVGIELRQDYTVDGETFRDPGNASSNFRFGGAPTVDSRELVTRANCNQCHSDLSVHGNNRTEIVNCLLCHTAGSEDKNNPAVAGGTPDVTIEFKVLIHKIHNGANLGSVLGVTTKTDGTRDYTATPKPYQVVGFGDNIHDFSKVQFPAWPVLSSPMPADVGYSAQSSTEQDLEDTMRSGVVACDKCHGDPDGAGPLPAPADGGQIYTQLTRLACGSCHDDWVWDRPYEANLLTMPPQLDDSACTLCHKVTGNPYDVMDAHTHPLVNPTLATGANFNITDLSEAGTHNSDNTIDAGEKISITFTLKDNAGTDIPASALSRIEVGINGATTAPNLLLFTRFPIAALGAGPSYTTNVPQTCYYEFVGDSTASNGDTFTTAKTPHWNVTDAITEVRVRTATLASSTLAAAAPALQNYVDLATGGGASFARDDFIVIDDGVVGKEEYLLIQWVEGDRLWFSSQYTRDYAPSLKFAHTLGATVTKVTLTLKTQNTDYSLNTTTGLITELIEFGTGNAVVVLYTSDFVMPAAYPGTLNESPGLGQDWSDWLGLSTLSGTYTLGIWGRRTFTVSVSTEDTSYNDASPPATIDFLVGDATTIVPNTRISSSSNCYLCHDDIQFHGGGRRGYETCLVCHGSGGTEDRPRYVAANAPATADVTIDFRTMLHKIHQGKDLDKALTYNVVGFGTGYPDNFSNHMYDGVGFPVMPGGTKQCTYCHGASNTAWVKPAARVHPAETTASRVWRAPCGSCHDSDEATAHINIYTPMGVEACADCHDPGKPLVSVEQVHKAR
ncbi:MAG: multiheme c-type cytochrome, partial [Planctomycetota bacterium]|jgi:OmcA/MtrC family decaheme c-type cytochrome